MRFSFIKILLVICFVSVIFVCSIPIKSAGVIHFLLRPIEKKLNKNIEFTAARIWLPALLSLQNIAITDESGTLYYCEKVNLKYDGIKLLFKKGRIFFNFKNMKLYKNVGLLDSVADILVISKMPDVGLDEISGTLYPREKAVYAEDVYACNDKMRIRGNGWIYNDGSLDCDVKFSFSEDVTENIPDAIKTTLLKDEGGGWMAIAFKARGNYKRPSLNITGASLKLNIIEGVLK